jgi:hypothetical protein
MYIDYFEAKVMGIDGSAPRADYRDGFDVEVQVDSLVAIR